jgi:hypothetical protein
VEAGGVGVERGANFRIGRDERRHAAWNLTRLAGQAMVVKSELAGL